MRPVARWRFSDVVPACIIFSSLAVAVIPVLPAPSASSFDRQEPPAAALGRIRSMAETQHEIVMLLLRKKDFDQAEAEACKIFDMNWPADQESLLLKELVYLSDQFLREGQPLVAIRLLDSSMRAFKTPRSQAAVWKEKGYLFKNMKQDDKALECFRTAQRLEQK